MGGLLSCNLGGSSRPRRLEEKDMGMEQWTLLLENFPSQVHGAYPTGCGTHKDRHSEKTCSFILSFWSIFHLLQQ